MRRLTLRVAVLSLLTLFGAIALAQRSPNIERGFKPGKVYDVLGLDTVNVFNGNLNMAIPIGQRFPNGGGMSYGLSLVYNSKVWDYERRFDLSTQDPSQYWHTPADYDPTIGIIKYKVPYMLPFPSRKQNAGLGFTVTLGRLIPPNDKTYDNLEQITTHERDASYSPLRTWVYESPDGAEHELEGCAIASTSCGASSWDSTFMRLRVTGATALLEFSDGSKHTFVNTQTPENPAFRITTMVDPFGNTITVNYPDVNTWEITDSFNRKSYVRFRTVTNGSPNMTKLVREIEVPSADPAHPAKYTLEYDDGVSVGRSCFASVPPSQTTAVVSLLRRVILPDGTSVRPPSRYTFDYQAESACNAGELTSMGLPTGGQIHWGYGPYSLPVGDCGAGWVNYSNGVYSRTLNDGSTTSTWSYKPAQPKRSNSCGYCQDLKTGDFPSVQGGNSIHALHITPEPFTEASVVVTTPNGDKTTHFFSVWPENPMGDFCTGPVAARSAEYGLPFTRRVPDSSGHRFLSTQTVSAAGKVLRTSFVEYEGDPHNDKEGNHRVKSTRTVFDEEGNGTDPFSDVGHKYVDVEESDYLGYGHYRTSVTSTFTEGNAAPAAVQTTTTEYTFNTTDWLLNLYSSRQTTQTPSTAGAPPSDQFADTEKQLFCFNTTTGFLNGMRRLANGSSEGAGDIVILFGANSRGDVTSEKSMIAAAGDLSGCTSSATPKYQTNYTYANGVLATAQPVGVAFKTIDVETYPATGLVKKWTDPAAYTTIYTYDVLGRTVTETPIDGAWTDYQYFNATRQQQAHIEVLHRAHTGGGVLAQSGYDFDGLGRIVRERTSMADGHVSARDTTYDGNGWKKTVSELYDMSVPGTPKGTTYSEYDPFGRPGRIAAADGATTLMTYTGTRLTKHEIVGTPQKKTEEYDGFGRLIAVAEPSSATGTDVTTSYQYDVGNRLVKVTTAGPSATQIRRFHYDARGFLLSEQSPERGPAGNGSVVYGSYDAHGHAESINDGRNQIWNAFDPLERLVSVGVGATSATAVPITELFYDSAIDPEGLSYDKAGRLLRTVRHNRVPSLASDTPVSEFFHYDGPNGTISSKVTTVGTSGPRFTQNITRDDLGLVTKLEYPTCSACGGVVPPRNVEQTYVNGMLTEVKGFTWPTSPITYAPSGIVTRVEHVNRVTDTIVPDPDGMSRPRSISFAGAGGCTIPSAIQARSDVLSATPTSMSARLSVTVGGTEPFAYTWYEGPAHDVVNSTVVGNARTYLTPPLTQSKSYWVRVTNPCANGTTESNSITVSVGAITCQPPTITTQPANQIVPTSGNTAHLIVGVAGYDLTYKWYRGSSGNTSSIVAGATGSSLDVAVTGPASYWVSVTNDCGTTNSATVNVSITTPVCSTPPTPVIIHPDHIIRGQTVVLSTDAVGDSYQWYQLREGHQHPDETPITNSNTRSITQIPSYNTLYRVAVTTNCTPVPKTSISDYTLLPVNVPVGSDFDGDGKSDLLFKNFDAPSVWIANNTAPDARLWEATMSASTEWHANAVGAFDGGPWPWIAWHNNATGEHVVWKWNGHDFGANPYTVQSIDPEWRLVGAGDFTNDLRADLVFRNYKPGSANSGMIRIWPMNGTSAGTPFDLTTSEPDLAWKIVAVVDFDHDGVADLVWRNNTTLQNRLWLLLATGNLKQVVFPQDPNNLDVTSHDANWKLVGANDYDGDGEPDLLFWNQTTKAIRVWKMFNAQYSSAIDVPPQTESAGRVQGGGDYDACIPPSLTISASAATSFCTPGSVTLTASGNGPFLWSNGATTKTITVNSSATYTVTVTSPDGCTASASSTVAANAPAAATITANRSLELTKGDSIVLTASAGHSYAWSTGETTSSISTTSAGEYWVTVTDSNGCTSTSPHTTVTMRPPAPVGVVATYRILSGAPKVQVTWTEPPGGPYDYVVQRAELCATCGGTPNVDNESFVDVPNPDPTAVASKAYLYRVLTVDGTQRSKSSNLDMASTFFFTPDPVLSGMAVDRTHVTSLRASINAVRQLAGLPIVASWSDLTPALVAINANHINELRNALNEALDRLARIDSGLGRPFYADPALGTGIPIRAIHIQQLRERVK
jgi:hypothetical protein